MQHGRIQDFRKGGSFICRAAAEGSLQRRVVLLSPREVRKKFSPLFFTYQDGLSWHIRAFCTAVPDVKGLQDPGPPCASISCSNFDRSRNVMCTYT